MTDLPAADLPAAESAVIVVDMQNSYLHAEGAFARLWPQTDTPPEYDPQRMRRAIPGCRRLIDAAHREEIPVVYLRYVYRPDYRDGGILIREVWPALKDANYVAAGTWEAEMVDELTPAEGDFVVEKSRYSGFYATRLETVLRSLGAKTLYMCGVGTRHCVESTARDAHMRDYRVFIVADATADVGEDMEQSVFASFSIGFGWVASIDEVVASWQAGGNA